MVEGALFLAGSLCLLAALAYALLRHVYVAALTAAAPVGVAGVFFVFPIALQGSSLVLGVYLAPICAILIYDCALRSICAGAPARTAVASALGDVLSAVGPILAVYALMSFAFLPTWEPGAPRFGHALTIFYGFTVALALGTVAIWLPYPEDYIARANAARERHERLFARPAGLSETRWSLSVSGIGLVLATIAVFGIVEVHAEYGWREDAVFVASAILVAAAFAAITRNWRLTLAATLAALLAALLVSWTQVRAELDSIVPLSLWFDLVLEFAAMSVFVQRMSRRVNRDHDPPTAIAVTLRELGPATLAAFLVLALVATVDVVRLGPVALSHFTPVIAGLAAALLFFPAFGNALYRLLPRYRSVDEVFGKH